MTLTHRLSGDLLISRRVGTAGYEISTIPGPVQSSAASYSSALLWACEVAKREYVDVWHTEDSTCFRRVAGYRVKGRRPRCAGQVNLMARNPHPATPCARQSSTRAIADRAPAARRA